MIDIHSHLIYGVDDGVKTLDESIDVLKDLKKAGYSDVIITPHYIKDSKYTSDVKENEKRLKKIKKALEKNNIDINVYLGNEIYIDKDIDELLDSKKIASLNNTDYLLIELPLSGEFPEYLEILSYLISRGYEIILAHPERYVSFQKNFNKVYELEKLGVYFQCNLDSITGKYGEDAKNTIIRMLEEKKVTFLGTDIHHKKEDYAKWVVAKALILNYISEDELKDILYNNAKAFID